MAVKIDLATVLVEIKKGKIVYDSELRGRQMRESIEFKNSISTEEFCGLREAVGFQKLPNNKYGHSMLIEL